MSASGREASVKMIVGPRDGRRKRSRCLSCSKSHFKCSGTFPCSNCAKRNQTCEFPGKSQLVISMENGKHFTSGHIPLPRPSNAIMNVEDRLPEIFFDHFIPRNSFTGDSESWILQLQQNFSGSAPLSKALVALGALQALSSDASKKPHFAKIAFEAYQQSAVALRRGITNVTVEQAPQLLSTAFLLGLFELIHDPDGLGWKTHTMYGTSRILQVLGPDAARRSPATKSFFLETRVFEIGRCVLWSEKSPLARPEWLALNQDLSTPEEWLAGGAVLNIMLQASSLCSRTLTFVHFPPYFLLQGQYQTELRGFADEGFRLRQELENLRLCLPPWQAGDDKNIIHETYFHAISIYLSGIYDYDVVWNEFRIPVPTLSEDAVRIHVSSILELTDFGLRDSSISGLLFLIPLRIAGARCWEQEQEKRITQFLLKIKQTFAVAHTFITELGDVWTQRGNRTRVEAVD